MKKLLLIISLFMITSCISTPPTPDDNKKSTPRCCVGQETHTCGMPGMPPKPEPVR